MPIRGAALHGERVDLMPVDPDAYLEPLWEVSHNPQDPDLWQYLFYGPFRDREAFHAYLNRIANSPDEIFYAIVDKASGEPAGIASYLRIVPEHGCIEIGHIWFGVTLQRSPAATEAIAILAGHVFDDLGYRRLEWKCDAKNTRSRRAAIRFGFSFEGIFRQHLVVKRRNRDTAWYGLTDRDWPRTKRAFALWLEASNFDCGGHQKRRLSTIRYDLMTRTDGARAVEIRDAVATDRVAWLEMWAEYNRFYESAVPADVTDLTWSRILGPADSIGCLVALIGGKPVGFANYLLELSTWDVQPRCLLEDLYVRTEVRSQGVGRCLIEALVSRAKAEDWTEIFWLTREDNIPARRLYENMTPSDGFIRYTIRVEKS
jgi:RimJ/RimL family protein N-acetyltransferase